MRKNLCRRSSGAVTWLNLVALVGSVVLAGGSTGCKSARHPGVGATSDAAADRGGNPGSDGGGAGDGRAGGDLGAGGSSAGSDGGTEGGAPGPEAGGPAGADAAGSDGAAGGADAAPDGDAGFGAACNALVPATPVTVVCAGDGGVTSTPAGGTIATGTYVLTGLTAFGPCIVLDVAQTLIIGATTIQTVVQDSITGVARANSTYTVSGTGASAQLVETNTCPDTTTRTLGFTAVGNTLTLYSTDSGTTTVAVLTRQ